MIPHLRHKHHRSMPNLCIDVLRVNRTDLLQTIGSDKYRHVFGDTKEICMDYSARPVIESHHQTGQAAGNS